MGGISNDGGGGISHDAYGNVYTTGFFQATADFDPGPGVFNLTPFGGSDIFVSKLGPSGNFIWAKKMGGSLTETGMSINTDNIGNSYIIGYFQGTVDFDPGPGTFNLTSAGGNDIFVSKLDPSGNFLWAKRMGGGSVDYGECLAIDIFGNVYTTGLFAGTSDFDPGPGTFNMTAGGADIFVSKLNTLGDFVWAKQMGGGPSGDGGYSITVDSLGNVYTTGYFTGTGDFDPGPGFFNLVTASASHDIFVSKLDTFGNFVWAKQMGGPDEDHGLSVALDDFGNIYTTGTFYDTVDFDPDTGVFNLSSLGNKDVFISKLGPAGNLIWAKNIGSPFHDYGRALAVNNYNNIYITGNFGTTVDFDPGPAIFNLTANGSTDVFILKLNSSGSFVWAGNMGGATIDDCYSISLDSFENVYTTGLFQNTADFNPGPGVFNLNSAGAYEIFVSKLGPCVSAPNQPSFISGNIVICSGSSQTYSVINDTTALSYVWTLPSGWTGVSTTNSINTTASSTSGNITITAYNACGSSSPQTLSITVNVAPAMPGAISGSTLVCSGTNNTYSVTAVPGATSYTWILPGGWTGSSTTNSINTTTSSTSGNVTVTANNSCGTSSAQTLAVTVNPLPNIVVTAPGSICSDTTACFSATGGMTYSWVGPCGFSSTNSTICLPGTILLSCNCNYVVTGSDMNGCMNSDTVCITVIAAPTVDAGTNINICTGDTTQLNGSSTTGYSWSPGATLSNTAIANPDAFPSGDTWYYLTAVNGTCSSTDSVQVVVNSLPTVTATATDTSLCNGDAVTLTGSGASSFNWTGGGFDGIAFNPSGTATYTVTGTDMNSCSNTNSVTVTVNSLPTVIANATDTNICNGDAVTLTGSGASSYNWSGGVFDGIAFNPSGTATYTVTGTDVNSCSNTSTITVIVNNLPTVTANATDTSICSGDPVTLTGSGASSYIWNGSVTNGVAFNPSGTASYTVTGTDINSCSNTSTITITVSNLPTVNFNYPGADTVCTIYGLQLLSGGTPSGGTYSGAGVLGTNFDPNAAGTGNHTITYSFTDANGCSAIANSSITVLGCSGLDQNDPFTLQVYPNPFDNYIQVIGNNTKMTIKLYNTLGEVIYTQSTFSGNTDIYLGDIRAGIYYLSIETEYRCVIQKLLKN